MYRKALSKDYQARVSQSSQPPPPFIRHRLGLRSVVRQVASDSPLDFVRIIGPLFGLGAFVLGVLMAMTADNSTMLLLAAILGLLGPLLAACLVTLATIADIMLHNLAAAHIPDEEEEATEPDQAASGQ